jgi:GPH family glycoside/pentoside/hexuronide:cation symporter
MVGGDYLVNLDRLSNKERFSYVIAGFGQNMVITFVVTFMLIYLYEGVGFSTAGVATLTVILTIAKIWDAVNDLLMGVMVDHTRSRWGKLRPYILFTAAPVAILTVMLFTVPNLSEAYRLYT